MVGGAGRGAGGVRGAAVVHPEVLVVDGPDVAGRRDGLRLGRRPGGAFPAHARAGRPQAVGPGARRGGAAPRQAAVGGDAPGRGDDRRRRLVRRHRRATGATGRAATGTPGGRGAPATPGRRFQHRRRGDRQTRPGQPHGTGFGEPPDRAGQRPTQEWLRREPGGRDRRARQAGRDAFFRVSSRRPGHEGHRDRRAGEGEPGRMAREGRLFRAALRGERGAIAVGGGRAGAPGLRVRRGGHPLHPRGRARGHAGA